MWETIAITATTAFVTMLVKDMITYFKTKSKKAIEAKKIKDKKELQENIKEVMRPAMQSLESKLGSLEQDMGLIKKAQQSNIRIELRDRYNDWIKKGYAPSNIREDLENLYQAYHNLGKNGIMDNLREIFLELPLEPPRNNN